MFDCSWRTLKILAALVWYIGGVVLLLKGIGQLERALDLRSGYTWPGFAMVAGVLLGIVKGRFLFAHACRKNLARIEALQQPKLWQFYRTGFFLFIFSMILLGRFLSWSATGHYPALLGMAILELSLATALLGSSYIFWQKPGGVEESPPAE